MNKYTVIAAVLGVSVVYWMYAEYPALTGETTAPVAQTAAISRPAVPAAPIPQAPEDAAKFSDGTQFDDGTEMVLGIPVRKDRNCTVEFKDYVTPTGEMFSAYTCTPNEPRPPHVYANYSNETLESMAYSDAVAAALLGQRLIEEDTGKSYELLIRASALEGGNVEHIVWLADMAFNPTALNGEPQIENLEGRYELAALSTHLGHDPIPAAFLRHELVSAGVDEKRLSELDRRADGLLKKMQDIQRTVIGQVTIGG